MIYILIIAHDGHNYLAESILSLQDMVSSFVFVDKLPFFGEAGDWQSIVTVTEVAGAT